MSGKHNKQDLPTTASAPVKQAKPGVLTQVQAYYSGLLPHPDHLAKYNEVIPNGAERIMAMAERQSAHREELESLVVNGNLANQTRGSIFAFILALVIVLGGIFLMYVGKDVYGFATIIMSIVSLASVFVYSKREQRKERIEKAEALQSRIPR
ncbi:MAG: DUF2335 domain-containing protein [Acidobacteriaceae bacterium]